MGIILGIASLIVFGGLVGWYFWSKTKKLPVRENIQLLMYHYDENLERPIAYHSIFYLLKFNAKPEIEFPKLVSISEEEKEIFRWLELAGFAKFVEFGLNGYKLIATQKGEFNARNILTDDFNSQIAKACLGTYSEKNEPVEKLEKVWRYLMKY